jgi:ankyrin repeat protein
MLLMPEDVLLYAAMWGHTDTVQLLLAGPAADDDAELNSSTARHHAALTGRTAAVKLL